MGPSCSTAGYPGGNDNVISVGSTDENVTASYFSSNGPALSTKSLTNKSVVVGTCSSKFCGNNKTCALIKPNLVAPGELIRSAWNVNDTAFISYSGTDFATPQVSGLVTLLICANRKVSWNYTMAFETLTKTTDTSRIDLLCERQNKGNSLASKQRMYL